MAAARLETGPVTQYARLVRHRRLTNDNTGETRASLIKPGGTVQGYVLEASDGELMFQSSGEIVIKLDPPGGSNDLPLGTQLMPVGAGVLRHVHAYWDE